MKRKYLGLILGISLMPWISGCMDGNFFDIQSTMKPPSLSEDEVSVKSVLNRKLGNDFILKYPKRGEYRSAILFYDFGKKGQDDAIIFYQMSSERDTIHTMIMQKAGGAWNVVEDYLNNGSDIDKVCFGDLNSDGKDEILVGFSDFETNLNDISAYDIGKDSVNEIKIGKKYIEFSLVDNNSILLLSPASTNNNFGIHLMKIKNQKFIETSALKFSDSIISCNSLLYGNIDENNKGFFLDYTNFDGQTGTEIIYIDDKLKRFTSKVNVINSTKRGISIISRCINGDDIINVPLASEVEDVMGDEKRSKTYLLDWSKFDLENEEFSSIKKSICSYDMGYNFFVPDSWGENIVCYMDEKYLSEKFYEQDIDKHGNKDVGDLLLEIKKLSLYDWNSLENKEKYVLLSEDNGTVYIALVPQIENDLAIDKESLKENFEIINN